MLFSDKTKKNLSLMQDLRCKKVLVLPWSWPKQSPSWLALFWTITH